MASLRDKSLRSSLNYSKIGSKTRDEIKFAFLLEENAYSDLAVNLHSENIFSTLFADYNKEWYLKNWLRFSLGTTHMYNTATTPAYLAEQTDYQASVFFSTYLKVKSWKLMASVRQQWARVEKLPIIPSISFEYVCSPTISLKGKISQDYRLPTLNDRFWVPGGNADLESENGWSEEVGLVVHASRRNIILNFEFTAFNRLIENWIIWTRIENQSFFSPRNITRVWSRGMEQNLDFKYYWSSGENFLEIKLNGSLLSSTNQVAVISPKMEAGQQLIYTPHYQYGLQTSVFFHKKRFTYYHLFTGGYRGINLDLPGYDLGSMSFSADLIRGQKNITGYLRINNLWNKQYQAIENRAMPGRNFVVGINLKIENKAE
jgi:iron complex outermembrane receptor protein